MSDQPWRHYPNRQATGELPADRQMLVILLERWVADQPEKYELDPYETVDSWSEADVKRLIALSGGDYQTFAQAVDAQLEAPGQPFQAPTVFDPNQPFNPRLAALHYAAQAGAGLVRGSVTEQGSARWADGVNAVACGLIYVGDQLAELRKFGENVASNIPAPRPGWERER